MAKNNSPQRPSDKPNCESAESQDLADKRIERREKEPGKDESCSRAIQEEVVPFNGRAHGAGDDGLNQGASGSVRRCIELANLELLLGKWHHQAALRITNDRRGAAQPLSIVDWKTLTVSLGDRSDISPVQLGSV